MMGDDGSKGDGGVVPTRYWHLAGDSRRFRRGMMIDLLGTLGNVSYLHYLIIQFMYTTKQLNFLPIVYQIHINNRLGMIKTLG